MDMSAALHRNVRSRFFPNLDFRKKNDEILAKFQKSRFASRVNRSIRSVSLRSEGQVRGNCVSTCLLASKKKKCGRIFEKNEFHGKFFQAIEFYHTIICKRNQGNRFMHLGEKEKRRFQILALQNGMIFIDFQAILSFR